MKDSISSIAARIGVSTSTVSRVLSGKYTDYRISEKTAALVLKEAERCNFMPNRLARSLRVGHTDTIGLVVPMLDNPFFATLACTVVEFLEGNGYHAMLSDSRESEEAEKEAIRTFLTRNVDGIIIAPAGADPSYLEKVNEDIPVILIDRYYNQSILPYVSTDNYAGGKMAAELFVKKGCKRILSIQGVPWSMPNKERKAGFCDVLSRDESIVHEVCGNDFSVENGYRVTLEEFRNGPKYDAIFAYSSTIMLGVIRALRELGLRMPEDVAVISFDNNGFFDFLEPPVTRVEQPLKDIGRLAVELLLEQIAGAPSRSRVGGKTGIQKLLTPQLVVRESC